MMFLEWSEDYEACYDPSLNNMTKNPEYGLHFIQDVFRSFDLENDWGYFDEHTNTWYGQSTQSVISFSSSADLLINLSGITSLREIVENIPIRIFLDTDPLFTQIRHLQDEGALAVANQHTHHFSFAENIAHRSCTIPNDGFQWQITRQPIVLEEWKVQPNNPSGAYTTVMQWDSYKSQEFDGLIYGMKSKSFSLIEDLPSIVKNQFKIAVGSESTPKNQLIKQGWQLLDPLEITKTPLTYQEFISNSKAEFTIAKHGYVLSKSGWFSERSAAYLASGRPVITQETGFSAVIPTGKGLFSFSEKSEAIYAIKEIDANYNFHCRAARKIAEEYFNHNMVLQSMLSRL